MFIFKNSAALLIKSLTEYCFPEAITKLEDYFEVSKNVNAPILANITEFGLTPMFEINELKNSGVKMILYPLSAFRAMSNASEEIYE